MIKGQSLCWVEQPSAEDLCVLDTRAACVVLPPSQVVGWLVGKKFTIAGVCGMGVIVDSGPRRAASNSMSLDLLHAVGTMGEV
jgi:hypothetical protein